LAAAAAPFDEAALEAASFEGRRTRRGREAGGCWRAEVS
jgi:hypothetical protein